MGFWGFGVLGFWGGGVVAGDNVVKLARKHFVPYYTLLLNIGSSGKAQCMLMLSHWWVATKTWHWFVPVGFLGEMVLVPPRHVKSLIW